MTFLQNKQNRLSIVFRLVLTTFVAWDFANSTEINQREEPPLIAAGSGKASTGAHCSLPK